MPYTPLPTLAFRPRAPCDLNLDGVEAYFSTERVVNWRDHGMPAACYRIVTGVQLGDPT